jgi:hypothetical protein
VGTRIRLVGWLLVARAIVAADFFDSWQRVDLTSKSYEQIAFGNDTFVAVGRENISTSNDALTWRKFPAPETDYPSGVTFGNGRFVMVAEPYGGVSMPGRIFTSLNGEDWSPTPIGAHELSAVTFGDGRFIAGGRRLVTVFPGWESRASFFRSQNGIDWEYQHVDLPGGVLSIAFDHGVYVAVGWRPNNYGVIYRSTDGSNWEPADLQLPPTLRAVAAGNGVFVAVGFSDKIFTSKDGQAWSEQTGSLSGYFEMADFANGTLFIGRMYSGDFATSSDGQNWISHKFSGDETVRSVVFGQGRFAGLGYLGHVMLSQDISTPLLSLNRQSNGVRIQIAAEAGKQSNLLESTNLTVWLPAATVTNTTTILELDRPATAPAFFFKLHNQTAK